MNRIAASCFRRSPAIFVCILFLLLGTVTAQAQQVPPPADLHKEQSQTTLLVGTQPEAATVATEAGAIEPTLHLQQDAVRAGEERTFQAANQISAGPAFTIERGAKAIFQAGHQVRLSPGFVAQQGSHFQAMLDPKLAASGADPRIVITPGSALLTTVGDTRLLAAQAFDAQGAPVTAPITWSSSDPTQVRVDPDGRVTAVASVGSAQITASAAGFTTAAILVIVAEPVAGAVLVADQQIVAGVTLVTPNVPPVLGSQYRVTLAGVPLPAPGTIMFATGEKPFAGRVVSATAVGPNVEVVLAVVTLTELFANLSIDQHFARAATSMAVATTFADAAPTALLQQPFASRQAVQTAIVQTTTADDAELEFKLGAFSCTAKVEPPLSAEMISMNVTVDLDPDLVISIQNHKLERFLLKLQGNIEATLSRGFTLTLALESSIKCRYVTHELIVIADAGLLSFFIAPVIPIGVGFDLEGKFTAYTLEAALEGKLQAAMTIGVDYSRATGGKLIKEFTPTIDVSPKLHLPSAADIRLGGSVYLYEFADFNVSLFPFLRKLMTKPDALSLKLIETTVGVRQGFDLAPKEMQNADPDYAANYDLTLQAKAGLGSSLSDLLEVVSNENIQIDWSDPAIEGNLTLARSPAGVLSVDRSATPTNQSTIFTVALDPATLTYPVGFYNVESIEIYRVRDSALTPLELMARLPAKAGDATFKWVWTPNATDIGENRFVAFVTPRFPGWQSLEIAPDSAVKVMVGSVLGVAKSGFGAVTSTPAGIDCGPLCRAMFPNGALITLTATAETGFLFAGWQGDCQGTAAVTTVTLAPDAFCEAHFLPYGLTIVTPATLPQAAVGSSYAHALVARGGRDPYSWQLSQGSAPLPNGLTLNRATGVIAGTPQGAGQSLFTVEARDIGATMTTKSFSLAVAGEVPLTIVTPAQLPTGSVGLAYVAKLAAVGGTALPYTWYIVQGALPSGLQLDATTGLLSGIPRAAGTATFRGMVRDSAAPGGQATQSFMLIIQPTAPAVPTNLTATSRSAGQIDLTWQDVQGETHYEILRRTGSSWSPSIRVNADNTHYSDTGLTEATYYVYTMRACYADSCSAYTTGVDAATWPTLPAAPSGLFATATTAHAIYLQWQDTAYNETGYRIERRLATQASWTLVATSATNSTSYLDSGLETGSAYCYRVSAYNNSGSSLPSSSSCVATVPVEPLTINTVSPLANGVVGRAYSQALVAGGGTPPYTWRVAGGWLPAGLMLNSTTGEITGAPARVESTSFWVEVRDNAARSATKAFVLSIDWAALNAPGAPSNLTVVFDSASNGIRLSWTDNANDEYDFTIRREPGFTLAGFGPNVTSYLDKDAFIGGTRYCYIVWARNISGESAPSNRECVTPPAPQPQPPAAPSKLTVTHIAGRTFLLQWQDNSDNETIFWVLGRDPSASTALTYVDSTLPNIEAGMHDVPISATKYCYRVGAFNDVGPRQFEDALSNEACIP